jgi:hypothetical protein
MSTNLIVIIVAIVIILILLKYVTKTAVKIAAIVVVLVGLGLFIFLKAGHTADDINFSDAVTEYSISDLKQIYCESKANKSDSLKCICIIQPISEDLSSRFTQEELDDLEKHRLKFAKELIKSINNKKDIIKAKLKENNANELLKEFKEDLLNKNLKLKLKENN